MEYAIPCTNAQTGIQPRIIIHGGAGNITRDNLSLKQWQAYRTSLLRILYAANEQLTTTPSSKAAPTAIDVATYAVSLLETDPPFNAGIGAVFTRSGTIELEASVMATRGYRKRGVGVSLLKHVRSPVKLAAEMLKRGNEDDGGGAGRHCQLSGPEIEKLAESWGLEMCEERTFWTRKRWEEHKRGLKNESRTLVRDQETGEILWPDNDPGWDGQEYLPQGTVGAVVLDTYGTIAVATSTGGLTNKLPGRLGDTPTLGAGFWAEEWIERLQLSLLQQTTKIGRTVTNNALSLLSVAGIRACLGPLAMDERTDASHHSHPQFQRRAVAMSGTGNGDSFLKLCAVRTAAALARFSQLMPVSMQTAISLIAGPGGELQRSAGVRWGKNGEGEGGIIGIELVSNIGTIVFDFNRAMFRAWVDDEGKAQCMVFRDEF